MTLAVLHVDPDLLAVDKPPGWIVIPGRGGPERTVLDEARELHGRLWVVHRLDRGTSGVLLLARSAAAHRALNLAFDGRRVEKRYLALVRGAPPAAQRIDAWIAPARKGRMKPVAPGDPRGKPSATSVTLLERFATAGLALVECRPETGRTHQIRVHLAAAGTPLAHDPYYGEPAPIGDGEGAVILGRTPLHAAALELDHPVDGRRLRLAAPLPADLAGAIAWARALDGRAG